MLRLIFVLIVMAIGGVAAVRSRFGALLLYVWFALFRPQDWMWIDIDAYRPSLVLGLLVVVPALLTGIVPAIGHPLGIGSLVFLAAAFLAQNGATDPTIGWYWLDFLAKLILISLFAIRLTSTRARLTALVAVMAFSFGFHPIKAGFASMSFGAARYFAGVGGAFADNNTYALATAMTIPLLIATAQNAPWRWLRWTAAASAPFAFVTVISTFSRGGLVATGAASLVFVLLQRRRALLLVALAIVVPLSIWAMPLPEGYSERMSTITNYEEVQDDSALGRLHFWRVALDIAADRPLGIGLWNFEATYDRYDFLDGLYGRRRAVHNSHLQVLTETGWLGAATWILLFFTAFYRASRARAAAADLGDDGPFVFSTANALIASMTAFVVGGTFVSMALNDITWLTFALIASLDRFVISARQPAPSAAAAASAPSLPLAFGTFPVRTPSI